jgi:hypothetical protein
LLPKARTPLLESMGNPVKVRAAPAKVST